MDEARSAGRAWRFFLRALRLRCPVCGRKPIFVPVFRIRSLSDWFTPLDGCPQCGYPYEREPGYFLMAVWAVNYGFGSLFGLAIYVFLEWRYHLPILVLLAAVLIPVALFNLLFARHAKAFFIALDHFFDPHEKEGGDEGGNKPRRPRPPEKTPPASSPPRRVLGTKG